VDLTGSSGAGGKRPDAAG